MSDFPLLFTVEHLSYSDGVDNGWGDPTEGWSDPIVKPVYGWGAPGGNEPKLAGDDRVLVDTELLVPPGFECSPRDRMVLDGDEFEVVGPVQRYDHNPFGWNPGGVVSLRRVTVR
ncbi:hypothetical protein [Williamsia phyllosphaerae]|uniref:Head-to-tail stopper n=1 Tax=Williamsia phyllosphaerae TaxID=885042 RepID=A0ABQ1V4V7_9NOCA|nr:hypothetical protein [Williamsia phyllosphaerae]GGF39094.1 hypothetical protein GCM10007298_38490 [Williamsia phyllosphaerae]